VAESERAFLKRRRLFPKDGTTIAGRGWAGMARTLKDPAGGAGLGGARLGARHDDRASGVMYDEVADAAEDRAPYLAQPARPHHHVAGLLARRHVHDELARLFEVRDEFAA